MYIAKDLSFFKNNVAHFFFNCLVLVVTVISHYVAIPFTRGFFCSDTSIKYPYKNNTIPTYAAVILSIGVPIVWVSE